MEKVAILSKHIVLCESTLPVHGIILIQGELIKDIIIFESLVTAEQVSSKFTQWNIIDYSDYYVSPGIIDLNVRKEWESNSTLTKSAVSGGTTFILQEPSFFNITEQEDLSELYCDLASLKLLTDENIDSDSKGFLACKAYLFQPCASVPAVTNLEKLFEVFNASRFPLFLDPNFPDPRMLYMASPLRLEKTEDHKVKEVGRTTSVFAAAYSESHADSNDSESEEDNEERTFTSLVENEIDTFKSKNSFSQEEYNLFRYSKDVSEIQRPSEASIEVMQVPKKKHSKSKNSHTIYDDLDQKIKEESKNIEVLCQAEKFTYQLSGRTKFSENSEPKNTTGLRRRPPGLSLAIPKVELTPDYTFYLANCPEYWESNGIKLISPKLTSSSRVHFQNISAASSVNMIRQLAESHKHVTCEIPASHLYFNSSTIGKNDTRFKSCPPIRSSSNFNLLWDLLKMRGINCISSQHAMIDPEHKAVETGSFQNALNGICTIQASLFAVWSTLNIPITKSEQLEHYIVRLSKWLSFHPAKVLGMQNRGSISRGKLADIIIWNPYCKSTLEPFTEYQKMCPYEGISMHGKIVKVFVRGKIAFENGNFYPIGKKIRDINSL